jgi:hypothetical protein
VGAGRIGGRQPTDPLYHALSPDRFSSDEGLIHPSGRSEGGSRLSEEAVFAELAFEANACTWASIC